MSIYRLICMLLLVLSALAIGVSPSWTQTISNNLLLNPGAENGVEGWEIVGDIQSIGQRSDLFSVEGMNFFAFFENGRIYQDVTLPLDTFPVSNGNIKARVSLYVSSYLFPSMLCRFLCNIMMQMPPRSISFPMTSLRKATGPGNSTVSRQPFHKAL